MGLVRTLKLLFAVLSSLLKALNFSRIMEDLISIDIFCEDESSHLNYFKDLKNWQQIPSLNHTPLHQLKDLSLVRFRGMVQDMSDPEVYLEEYVVHDKRTGAMRKQNGKYRDCLTIGANEIVDVESRNNVHSDRRTIFVISVPGMNGWVSSLEQRANVVINEAFAVDAASCHGQKRPFESGTAESMEVLVESAGPNSCNKRICSDQPSHENQEAIEEFLSPDYLLNSPLSGRPSKACMVKLYEGFDKFPLNTVLDIVGFLSVDPALDGSTREIDDFEEMAEVYAANPPPSLIPRLHAICVRELKHVNPLLDESFLQVHHVPMEAAIVIQRELHLILTQCLFGDAVAAEFLISNLVSNIFVRTDLQTLGKFSLNICGIPSVALPNYTKDVYDIIQSLLPATHYFPMTLENMNTQQFLPKKDYKTNKLVSGLLQLAPHTHLVLDETRLEPGKLENNGVIGIQSLADLIKNQQIKANFQYFEMKYDVNIPVLILSEGRSILPCDFPISLDPDPTCIAIIDETLKAAKHYIEPKLNVFRKYLTSTKLHDFNIDSATTTMIENQFLEIRKRDQKFGPDELSGLLILVRLLATSRGKNQLDKEIWELGVDLHSKQRARLENFPTRR